ncbi:hypothetical protein GH714_007154 [Hevea brasiliensis]|uniref:CCHC-type domain-containing protein n=1 Tax=Hevea brasiliensis TaxID=3981 RepID=A0A6A6MTR5_HEVBR|nr:hypothetical protein GH714_007154 [Hevea brasiliensis]
MDIPTFNGDLDIEGFLDWLTKVDHFFEYAEILEERKVKLVAYILKGGASVWWDRSKETRRREGNNLVTSWRRMQQLLRGRFLPPDYEQYLFESYQNCSQGTRSVNEYTIEVLRLAMMMSVQEARNLALKAEMVIKQKPFRRYGENKFAIEKEKGKTTQGASSSCGTNAKKSNNKALIVGGSKGANSNAPKAYNPYAKPAAIKCYRCNKIGHHSNECPKRKSVNIVEREPEDEEEEFCGPYGDDFEEEYEQEEGVYVVRILILSPKVKDNTQRHKLFRTRCTVNGKIFDLIINGGSQENIINQELSKNSH